MFATMMKMKAGKRIGWSVGEIKQSASRASFSRPEKRFCSHDVHEVSRWKNSFVSVRELVRHGCQLKRHGVNHDIYVNPQTGRVAPVPRHNEVKNTLVRAIRKQLGIG
ncbi:MAG: type II toxin-antitoxin system HicA family toxin [Chthoniobacterales bacterium]